MCILVIPRDQWEDILNRNGFNEVDIRDSRYNHIIHMVSAANGAEPFYTVEVHYNLFIQSTFFKLKVYIL